MIRKASIQDINQITAIYDKIHSLEENGVYTVGWKRGIYPTLQTALRALDRNDLYVLESDGHIFASAVINSEQLPEYTAGKWKYPANDDEVLVLHTLVVDPDSPHRGFGTEFVRFYESLGRSLGYRALRIDTQTKNRNARLFYPGLGFREAGIVDSEFNGCGTVELVLLEKSL